MRSNYVVKYFWITFSDYVILKVELYPGNDVAPGMTMIAAVSLLTKY